MEYEYDVANGSRPISQKRASILAKPAGVYAVFYDPNDAGPVVRDKKGQFDTAGYEKKALAACRQDLRAQVRDFVKWLKVQGVI